MWNVAFYATLLSGLFVVCVSEVSRSTTDPDTPDEILSSGSTTSLDIFSNYRSQSMKTMPIKQETSARHDNIDQKFDNASPFPNNPGLEALTSFLHLLGLENHMFIKKIIRNVSAELHALNYQQQSEDQVIDMKPIMLKNHSDGSLKMEKFDTMNISKNYKGLVDFQSNKDQTVLIPVDCNSTSHNSETASIGLHFKQEPESGSKFSGPKYAESPTRPSHQYLSPEPLTKAQKCDPIKCQLPNCRCGGRDIPGGLDIDEVPQLVFLTFDDSVNELNHEMYEDLFNSGRTNPNGCPILGTFYVSHEWTDYGQVQTLYSKGHEIASHTISHLRGDNFTQQQWQLEVEGQREILHHYAGVALEDIRGMRAPYLHIGGNEMFQMLYDANFTYDSSVIVPNGRSSLYWPYTLDYALSHYCWMRPCPNKSFPGVWEVGLNILEDLQHKTCSFADACSYTSDEEEVSKMLMMNFVTHYKTNRAPLGLFYHSKWFNESHHYRGFMRFLDEILTKEDVWLVTTWQLIQWTRNPTPLKRLQDFEPFGCSKSDTPPPCLEPNTCSLQHNGEIHQLRTCRTCPEEYPWVGPTGSGN